MPVILILLITSMLSLSAKAVPSCSVVLLDLASLKTQIETEKDPTVASALKRAYQTKLKEARTRQIDLTKLSVLSDEVRENHDSEALRKDEKEKALEDSEIDALLANGMLDTKGIFLNRYAVTTKSLFGLGSERVIISDIQNNRTRATLKRVAPFSSLLISPDSRWILLSSYSGNVLYDIDQQRKVFTAEGNAAGRFSPDGSKLILLTATGVKVWDLQKQIPELLLDTKVGGDARISADGLQAISQDWKTKRFDVWDLSSGTHIRRLPTDARGRTNLWSPDGRYFAVRRDQSNLKIYKMLKTTRPVSMGPSEHGFFKFKFSADSRVLFNTEGLSKVSVWDVQTGSKITEISMAFDGMKISPDNHFVATKMHQGYVVYDARNGEQILKNDQGEKAFIDFTKLGDKMQLVVMDKDGTVTTEALE